MKKFCLNSLFFVAITFSTVMFLSSQTIAQTNILQNHSFENNEGWGGKADGWKSGGNASAKGITIEVNAYQGVWAFNMGNDCAPDDVGAYTFQVLLDPDNPDDLYPVTSGDRVVFTTRIMGEENYRGNNI